MAIRTIFAVMLCILREHSKCRCPIQLALEGNIALLWV